MGRSKKVDFPVAISVKVGTQLAHGLLTDVKKGGEPYKTGAGDPFLSARMNNIVIGEHVYRVSLNLFQQVAKKE